MSEIEVSCCFCSKRIGGPLLSVYVGIDGDEDTEQVFWSHPDCFRQALHGSVRSFLRPELKL